MIRTVSWVHWYQDQPHTTALYRPCSSLLGPHSKSPYSPLQEPCSREDQWSYRNQTSIKMISMPRWVQSYQNQPCMTAPYGPHLSPLQPHSKSPYSPLWPCSVEITSPYSITRYTKVFSSTSWEKCTLWDLLSTANSPANGTANNIFRVYVYWKIQKQ